MTKRALVAALLVGSLACAEAGPWDFPLTPGGSDGGGGGGGSDAGGGGGGGGNGNGTDSYPTDTVSFFTGNACPTGWEPYTTGQGRTIVPTLGPGAGGGTRGTPLTTGEDRTHTHFASPQVTIGSVSYALVTGSGLNVGMAGPVIMNGSTNAASSGLPYVQLLVCRKTAAPVAGAAPLPSGLLLYTAATSCPTGFSQAAGTQGRFVVGLPSGGTNGATFGGSPIDGTTATTHTHTVSGNLVTTAEGVAGLSNGAATGYAQNGTYPFSAASSDGDVGLPSVHLKQCQKN